MVFAKVSFGILSLQRSAKGYDRCNEFMLDAVASRCALVDLRETKTAANDASFFLFLSLFSVLFLPLFFVP